MNEAAPWQDPLEGVDTRSPERVRDLFLEAAEANREASCRRGSVDVIEARGELVATGDIHDNPLNFARVLRIARLDRSTPESPRHVTLHEVIHAEDPVGGVDMSHRALLRVAALKVRHPELVHTLLANHELSQIVGSGIVKDGVRVVDAFDEGVERAFGEEAPEVLDAICAFIRSMPLALRSEGGAGSVLCAHSLPGAEVMDRFDPSVLDRSLSEADYEPRRGSAHLMVWGRKHPPEHLESLAATWGVDLFVLGHQKAESGWALQPPNAIILNSDHEAGVALPIDLAAPPPASDAVWNVRQLRAME